MLKNYESVVKSNIKDKIVEAKWADDLIQYATCKCEIDGLIAAGALFCPELIYVDGYIFVKKFLNCEEDDIQNYINCLEERYEHCKREIEMSVNTWSLGDFFIGDNSYKMDDMCILKQFGEVLCYFWKMRVDQLFPDKDIVVELDNEIMGEYGLCITMYERE